MSKARLSILDVTVSFGGLCALDKVTLKIDDNQLLGFIGPNGAGKTTLMRVIMGLIRPKSGRVYLNAEDITDLPTVERIHAGIALGQQIVKPLRQMSLLDNVALAVGGQKLLSPMHALFKKSRIAERETAADILNSVGLADEMHKNPNEVPLGFLKRLEVARALALRPELLLLDEPLAGLSKPEARNMADLIAQLPRPGLSVILIEHNLPEVMRVCPKLYVQANGKGLALGSPEEVMAMPEVRQAYLGKDM
ncbi:ABC transporter ATP-binding protein [Alphaproteobacteria bacterium LSUCC0684]